MLAGCGPAPGAAATVDGEVISDSDAAIVAEELSPYLQSQLSLSQAVYALVTAPVYVEVASEAGLGVSEEQAEATLQQLAAQAGIEDPEFSAPTLLAARSVMSSSAMEGAENAADLFAEATTAVDELDVSLSPRYGTWGGEAGIAAPTYDWLEQPAVEVE